MMERPKILPIGTVVYINEGLKKIMIIGRRLTKEKDGRQYYFDYTGCLFPEGLMSDEVIFLNEDDISKVVHMGLINDDELEVGERILEWEKTTTVMQASNDIFKEQK